MLEMAKYRALFLEVYKDQRSLQQGGKAGNIKRRSNVRILSIGHLVRTHHNTPSTSSANPTTRLHKIKQTKHSISRSRSRYYTVHYMTLIAFAESSRRRQYLCPNHPDTLSPISHPLTLAQSFNSSTDQSLSPPSLIIIMTFIPFRPNTRSLDQDCPIELSSL